MPPSSLHLLITENKDDDNDDDDDDEDTSNEDEDATAAAADEVSADEDTDNVQWLKRLRRRGALPPGERRWPPRSLPAERPRGGDHRP
jgi:hypothetical protein